MPQPLSWLPFIVEVVTPSIPDMIFTFVLPLTTPLLDPSPYPPPMIR